MNGQDETLQVQADQMAEEALNELGVEPLDEADESDDYAVLCDYAGCYPWLDDRLGLMPHDRHPGIAPGHADEVEDLG